MERRDHIDAFGAACLLGTAVIMGINQVMIKLVNAGLQPVFQVGLRSACAILPIIGFALITRRKLSVTDGSFWPGVLCGLLFAFEFILLFLALEFTTVSRADFAGLGVARLSLGSSLARATHRLIVDAGHAMFHSGDFSPLSHSIAGGEIDRLLQ